MDKKDREQEEKMQLVEYLAMMTSFDPKGVLKIVNKRRKARKNIEDKLKNPEGEMKVNEHGLNEYGNFVNTTFYETLKQHGGDEVLKYFEQQKQEVEDAKIVPFESQKENDKPVEDMDEDEKFLYEARKMFKEREKEMEEEVKFKKENPELFPDGDSVTF